MFFFFLIYIRAIVKTLNFLQTNKLLSLSCTKCLFNTVYLYHLSIQSSFMEVNKKGKYFAIALIKTGRAHT